MLRFDLNLRSDTGTVDPTFAPISVPGDPATAGVNIAHDAGVLVVLVTSGSRVYAYNAQTGAPAGSFATAVPVNAVATAGSITVLGSSQINELHMIDLTSSLRTGSAQAVDSTSPFVPLQDISLLGGLTGVAGSNNLYAAIAAHFSTLQPYAVQLGVEAIGTLLVNAGTSGTQVSDGFSAISQTGLVSNGVYTNVNTTPIPPGQIGEALGSVDQNLALDTGEAGGNNVLKLYAPSSLSSQRVNQAGIPRPPGRPEPELPDRPGRRGLDRHPGRRAVDPRQHGQRHVLQRHGQPGHDQDPDDRELDDRRPADQPPGRQVPVRTRRSYTSARDRRRPQRRGGGAEHPADRPDNAAGQ